MKRFARTIARSIALAFVLSWAAPSAGQATTATDGATMPRAPSSAQATTATTSAGELGLEELVRTVELRFPSILAAAQSRAAAEADKLSAEGGFDPAWRTSAAVVPLGGYPSQRLDTFVEQPLPWWGSSVFAGYRIGRGDYPVYDGKLQTNAFGEVRAGARINLWRDGPIDRRRANIQSAELGVEAAAQSAARERIEATRVASFRYWDWVAAGRKLAITRAWLDLAIARDAGLARRVEVGDVPAFERQENQRAILQRRAQAVSAQRAIEKAAIELSLFLRAEDGSPIQPDASRLPSSMPEPAPLDVARVRADERAAIERRPELRRLDAQKEQAAVERRLAENQKRPAVDVVIVGSQDLGAGDPKRGKPVLEAAVVVDIPLANRVATGKERAAAAKIARIEAETRLQRDRIVADVRDAASALAAAEERASVARAELDVARKLADQEWKRFELGEGTLLLVNLREQAGLDAELRQIDAVADWQKALAAYRAATAGAATALR